MMLYALAGSPKIDRLDLLCSCTSAIRQHVLEV